MVGGWARSLHSTFDPTSMSMSTTMTMNTSLRSRALVPLLGLAAVGLAGACEANRYPHCRAFEYHGAAAEPRLERGGVDPKDCGSYRAAGLRGELMVNEPEPLDCAIEAIAAGQPMKLALTYERSDAAPEDGLVFSDEDGLALWWRQHRDGTTEYEVRVHQLDVDRIAGCEDEAEDGARFSCFFDALEAADVVETCKTGIVGSE